MGLVARSCSTLFDAEPREDLYHGFVAEVSHDWPPPLALPPLGASLLRRHDDLGERLSAFGISNAAGCCRRRELVMQVDVEGAQHAYVRMHSTQMSRLQGPTLSDGSVIAFTKAFNAGTSCVLLEQR